MNFWALLTTIVKFLPELTSLVRSLWEAGQKGAEEIQIRRDLKKIDKAFKHEKPEDRARALNDAFRL